jgi:hypothetical protein
VQEIAGRFILNEIFRVAVRKAKSEYRHFIAGQLEDEYGKFDDPREINCLISVLQWLDDCWDTNAGRFALIQSEPTRLLKPPCCDSPPC